MVKRLSWLLILVIPALAVTLLSVSAAHTHYYTAQPAADPTCSSSSPCLEWDNSSTGPGLRGISASGNGIGGGTTFNSTSTINGTAGVFGADESTSGTYDSGVKGVSTSGNGVYGTSTSRFGVWGNSTSGYGVYGSSSASIGIDGSSTSSYGIVGRSSGSTGILGQTLFKGTSTGNATAGVFGDDNTTSSFNSGVEGFSKNGYGVAGTSTNGSGVQGTSTNSNGIAGTSTISMGVQGTSTAGYGVFGSSTNGPGVGAYSTHDIAVAGIQGIISPGPSPAGLDGASQNGTGVAASSLASGTTGYQAALWANSFGGGPIMIGSTASGDKMSLDASGNMILAGKLTTSGTPLVVTRTTRGQSVGTYTAQQSMPTLEDVGAAQLVTGTAYVQIDPKFAAAMEPRANYLVFVTPEGDSRGLYVTQKSPVGFYVRENMGGRSSLVFDYRIVAEPFDAPKRRLPLASELPHLGFERNLPVRFSSAPKIVK